MSFLRARSPVTPNITMTHGPATRGIRRSRGSRSGLTGLPAVAITPGVAGARPLPPACGMVIVGTSKFPLAGSLPAQLRPDRLQQFVPGRLELRHALVLKYLHDVVVADAELLQVGEQLAGL